MESLFFVLLPRLTYIFAVNFYDPRYLAKIQTKINQITLLKAGFNGTTPLAVIYGPAAMYGLGLCHLNVEQGIHKIILLIQHLWDKGDSSKLIQIAILWLQSVAPCIPILFMHDDWFFITSILQLINGTLHIPSLNPYITQPLWENDRCLMDIIINKGYMKQEQTQFNNVWLYYGVQFLSKIVVVDGCEITHEAWSSHHQWYTIKLWTYQE